MSNGKKVSSVRLKETKVSSSYARARRVYPDLIYSSNGKKLSEKQKKQSPKEIRSFLNRFSFTGKADGEADSVELTLINSDGRWSKEWFPKRKDKIAAAIMMKAWKKGQSSKRFPCGSFLVDSIGFSGPPSLCTIGATSIPETSSFRATDRDKSWKNATLKEIAKKITSRYKMKLVFDGDDFSVGTVEQDGQTDCAFLTGLCHEYAYGIKMFKGKLIIYSKAKYEAKAVVGTITKRMIKNYDYETNLCGSYTGAKMKYTEADSDNDTLVKVGVGNRWLTVNGSADSVAQARRKALAALNTENEKTTTLTISIRGNTRYNETDTVRIKGLNRLSGKYFIDEVHHDIDGAGGFTTQLSMHKVQKRVTE